MRIERDFHQCLVARKKEKDMCISGTTEEENDIMTMELSRKRRKENTNVVFEHSQPLKYIKSTE